MDIWLTKTACPRANWLFWRGCGLLAGQADLFRPIEAHLGNKYILQHFTFPSLIVHDWFIKHVIVTLVYFYLYLLGPPPSLHLRYLSPGFADSARRRRLARQARKGTPGKSGKALSSQLPLASQPAEAPASVDIVAAVSARGLRGTKRCRRLGCDRWTDRQGTGAPFVEEQSHHLRGKSERLRVGRWDTISVSQSLGKSRREVAAPPHAR
ncbi:hypothetical protein C8J57DRAFT_1503658 [Mycena rebaudengoi]|nr:hypothetical protein C8J57DRAFT_1503658 [Mycena rebaudengoi]